MQKNSIEIRHRSNNNIIIEIVPGHFATNHSHINYYINMAELKHNHVMARNAAQTLASDYKEHTAVDTIICLDGTEVIGSFIARALARSEIISINSHKEIHVVTPEFNSNGQMIFRDNLQYMIRDKHALLLLASATTGKTIRRSLECIKYYGAQLSGISALFSAIPAAGGESIHHLFGAEDLPGYQTWSFNECPECQQNHKIEAIVNSYGFSEL